MDQEEVISEVLERNETFLDLKNIVSKNLKKVCIFPFHGFCQKNGDQSIFCFYGKLIQKICFVKFSKQTKPFNTIKTSVQKAWKICIFFPWLLCKNGDFSIFCFYAMQIKIESFVRFWKEKKPFQTIKTSVQTTPEICIFAKGLVFGFCQKTQIFPSFGFSKMDKKKCFVKVLKEKKLFKNIKTSVQKKNPRYLHFSKWVSPCFFSKSGDFSIVCFYAKWIKKKCFLKFWKKGSFFRL